MPRPRKPTQVKIAEGNRGKRKLEPEKEPQYSDQNIEPILPLGKLAKKEWDRLKPIIVSSKVMTDADTAAFTIYCQNYELFCKARDQVDQEGLTYETVQGGIAQHPAVRTMNQASQIILRFLIEFGLTPAARSRVVIEKSEEQEDEYDKFKKQRAKERGKLYKIAGSNS